MTPETFREFKRRHMVIACGLVLGKVRRVYSGEAFAGMVDDEDPCSEFSYTTRTTEAGEREIRFGDGWTVNEDGREVT